MPTKRPLVKPRWWKLVLLPSWIGYTLELFALTMFVAFPVVAATPHGKGHWAIFAIVLICALGYGRYASHRIRRTILASDETSYTVRFEWVPRGPTTSNGIADMTLGAEPGD